MNLFVVSDIHSYYTPMMEALTSAGFFEDKTGILVLLGDALDRGGEAQAVVDFLLELQKEKRLIYVTGNHEDLLVDCLQAISRGEIYKIASGMSHHYVNRTFDSLLQLSGMSEREALSYPLELVSRVRASDYYQKLLSSCVDYFETAHHVFCHGWIPTRTQGQPPYVRHRYDPDWRDAPPYEWRRARWSNGMEMAFKYRIGEPKKTVVCGHWHTSWGHAKIHRVCSEWGNDAKFEPFHDKGVLAIDACTAHSGRVNVIRLSDAPLPLKSR